MSSYIQLATSIREGTPVALEDLEKVCSLSQVIVTIMKSKKTKRKFDEIMRTYVDDLISSPVLTLLDFETVWEEWKLVEDKGSHAKFPDRDFPAMLQHFKSTQCSQVYTSICLLNV